MKSAVRAVWTRRPTPRRTSWAGFAALAAILAVSCGSGGDITADPTTATTTTSTSTTTTSTTTTTTTSTPPTTTTTAPRPLVLAADGLGAVAFGATEAEVIATLTAAFGPPASEPTADAECGDPRLRIAAWPNLDLEFVDGRFTYWRLTEPESGDRPNPDLATARGTRIGDNNEMVDATGAEVVDVGPGFSATYGETDIVEVRIDGVRALYLWGNRFGSIVEMSAGTVQCEG